METAFSFAVGQLGAVQFAKLLSFVSLVLNFLHNLFEGGLQFYAVIKTWRSILSWIMTVILTLTMSNSLVRSIALPGFITRKWQRMVIYASKMLLKLVLNHCPKCQWIDSEMEERSANNVLLVQWNVWLRFICVCYHFPRNFCAACDKLRGDC